MSTAEDHRRQVGPASPTYEDNDCTPRSELPPVPVSDQQPARSNEARSDPKRLSVQTADGYFPPASTIENVGSSLRPTLSHTPTASTAPSVGISNATIPGHIQVPGRSLSLRSAGRSQTNEAIQRSKAQAAATTATGSSRSTATPGIVPKPYPNQAFSALHSQEYLPDQTRPFALSKFSATLNSHHASGTRSAGQTPGLSVGLYQKPAPLLTPSAYSDDIPGAYPSPYLHFTHTQVPKETHVADVDVHPSTGRKTINDYEIVDELGRGTHGKVKLGLHRTENFYVAIKIVERYSKRRMLGRLSNAEDKVKKEVAILKKARHPNVVALLEVIDDPSRKKVYIVLEWVENGEIKWRAPCVDEIAMVEARRYERERSGQQDDRRRAEDEAVLAEAQKRLARRRRHEHRDHRLRRRMAADTSTQLWSNEMNGDDSGESDDDRSLSRVSSTTTDSFNSRYLSVQGRRSRRPSRVSHADSVVGSSPPQYSAMSDPEDVAALRERRASNAMSSFDDVRHPGFDHRERRLSRDDSMLHLQGSQRRRSDDLARLAKEVLDSHVDSELRYVPVMSIEKIRSAFRDTLQGLQYLHYQGIVHRDIKPPNLLVTSQGRIKISDFGVSYLGRPVHEGEQAEELSEAESQDLTDEAKELAKTVGTPAFYAPELCITEPSEETLPVTKAIDVWALGITLFCMLFARTPFVDSEFVVMRQIADEEIYLPRKRLVPVNLNSNSRSNSGSRAAGGDVHEGRDRLEIEYEPISDDLHDLLRRLLTKDPRKRITLEEVRTHPWVTSDLPNKDKWLEEVDPSTQSQGKKIEISHEEMNAAVVPLNLIERVKSSMKKVTDRLTGARSRARSNASDSPLQSAGSSSSSVNRGARKGSTHGDEAIFSALKASREHEVVDTRASPTYHFNERNRNPSDTHVSHYGGYSDSGEEEPQPRPRPEPPSRANTLLSTAPSIATVKQSDFYYGDESAPSSPTGDGSGDVTTGGHPAGFFGGTSRRIMQSVRERTSFARLDRTRSNETAPSTTSGDRYAEPSLAICRDFAAGQLDPPQALKELDQEAPASGYITHVPFRRRSGYTSHTSSRRQSVVSMTSHLNAMQSQVHHGFLTRTSSSSSFRSAHAHHEPTQTSPADPSPLHEEVKSGDVVSAVPSLTTASTPDRSTEVSPAARGTHMPAALASSSSDFGSAVSASISNPSIPSMVSQASSFDPGDRLPPGHNREKRDPSSDNTINPDDDAEFLTSDERSHLGAGDYHYDVDDYDDDSGTSSDSDGGLIMTRRKSSARVATELAAAAFAAGRSAANNKDTASSPAPVAPAATVAPTTTRKSSRSGSNNTMKKVSTGHEDSEDGPRRDRASLETSRRR